MLIGKHLYRVYTMMIFIFTAKEMCFLGIVYTARHLCCGLKWVALFPMRVFTR